MKIIDFRFRPNTPEIINGIKNSSMFKATCEAIGFDKRVPQALPEIVADLDRRGVELCVVSGRDCETTYGFPANNNSILEFCRAYPNKFLGFWGIDPHKGMDAVREVEHVIKDLGMRGIATDPYLAHCPPSDARYYPIYAKCVELGVPVFVTTAPPAQVPRAIMDYIDPRQIDVVARDFPELILIMSHGGYPFVNEAIFACMRNANVYMDLSNKFLGFWGIDPHKGMDAVREVEHVIKDLGMRGIATDPYLAHCPPSDARYYPIYAKCVELGVPVFVTTAPPAQVPRAIMDYIDPRQIDVVARDFPELILIMSHGGYPFVNEAIFACMRNANVYMDLSEYELAPMAEVYVDALNKMIGDKVIFASAHPFIEQADAIEIYKNLNISEEVREKVMYKTAAKILGLDKGVSLNTVKPMAPNGFNNAKFPLPFQPFAPMGR